MYAPLPVARPLANLSGVEMDPTLNELSKQMHFFRFLQKEINTAKTQAEKEAVLGILLKTKIHILALEREWREIKTVQRPATTDAPAISTLYTTHRLQ